MYGVNIESLAWFYKYLATDDSYILRRPNNTCLNEHFSL